jgi:large subunit ribosomal protein L23
MTLATEKLNRYGFVVAKDANKIEIKKAVEELYNVTVESVNTLRLRVKTKLVLPKLESSNGRIYSKKSLGYLERRR